MYLNLLADDRAPHEQKYPDFDLVSEFINSLGGVTRQNPNYKRLKEVKQDAMAWGGRGAEYAMYGRISSPGIKIISRRLGGRSRGVSGRILRFIACNPLC